MMWLGLVLLSMCSGGLAAARGSLDFPPGFKFGAATAAYQVEGAWNTSDKSPSIWDVFAHSRDERMADHATGDVACDSYHQWGRDVQMAQELNLHFYRFSLSWPRLLPSGFANTISEDGKRYYNNLINGLVEAGIEPVVTLYHWDLPQNLQELGGWTNPLVVDWFADYARVAFSLYGDRVPTWLTLNEPLSFCELPYNSGWHAPGLPSPGVGNYLCCKHALLAHAKAWRMYDEEFRPKYHGRITIVNQLLWFEGETSADDDLAELARQLGAGIYSHAIYSERGGWPPAIEEVVAKKSKQESYPRSRLPAFTAEEIEFIRGTHDFFSLNYYTGRAVRTARTGENIGAWPLEGSPELDMAAAARSSWQPSGVSWLFEYPEGLRHQLRWLRREYGDLEFVISENGYPDHGLEERDRDRVHYYEAHLQQLLLAIHEDGANVTAYTAWSLMDNLEWSSGYRPRFGLYAVDFSDPARPRSPRLSAHFYAAVARARSLNVTYAHHAHARTQAHAHGHAHDYAPSQCSRILAQTSILFLLSLIIVLRSCSY